MRILTYTVCLASIQKGEKRQMELDELLSGLGVEPKPDVPPVTEPAPTGVIEGDPAPIADPEPAEPADPPATDPEPTPDPIFTKQNKAFAEMRVQNQQYLKTIKALGELLGTDANDPSKLLGVVQDKIVQAQSKAQGIPVEILNKLNMLEAESQRNQQQNIQQQTLIGFQTVKNQFGLDDKGLDTFAQELADKGINPFAQQVDLVGLYQNIHYKDILAKEVAKAVDEEKARALKAATQSTTPSGTNGGTPPTEAQVKDTKGLEDWFSKQNIK